MKDEILKISKLGDQKLLMAGQNSISWEQLYRPAVAITVTKFVYNTYNNATKLVKVHNNTNPIRIGLGVQGWYYVTQVVCRHSGIAFKILDRRDKCLNIEEQNPINLHFTDYIVLLAGNNQYYYQVMLQDIQQVCSEVDLQINISNTKFMT